ncbi:hypothetical protein E2C01_040837 [Portunus trituberculatus]|uniref:Uncharacterized protein n=1 Tax=Portunus trituberculatus TaxID=210409 RepID=A0A5B7FKU4_PORTR|nr:hypothetical protein [Portunus trituberculatus]
MYSNKSVPDLPPQFSLPSLPRLVAARYNSLYVILHLFNLEIEEPMAPSPPVHTSRPESNSFCSNLCELLRCMCPARWLRMRQKLAKDNKKLNKAPLRCQSTCCSETFS